MRKTVDPMSNLVDNKTTWHNHSLQDQHFFFLLFSVYTFFKIFYEYITTNYDFITVTVLKNINAA